MSKEIEENSFVVNETDQSLLFRESLSGKYMTFKLAREEYGLEILKVREIIGLMDITRVPRTEGFIRGVINLRGKVIPVVDLRLKFGMTKTENTDQTVIIVVQYHVSNRHFTMGILVDEVLEVLNIEPDMIEPPPNFGTGTGDDDFILGIGKSEKRVIFLLEIGKVLTARDTIDLITTAQILEEGSEINTQKQMGGTND